MSNNLNVQDVENNKKINLNNLINNNIENINNININDNINNKKNTEKNNIIDNIDKINNCDTCNYDTNNYTNNNINDTNNIINDTNNNNGANNSNNNSDSDNNTNNSDNNNTDNSDDDYTDTDTSDDDTDNIYDDTDNSDNDTDTDNSDDDTDNNNNSDDDTNNSVSLSEDDIIYNEYDLHLNGCILNKYNILTELGRGSYSIVWLAYLYENKKYYAIKVQNPDEYSNGINENNFIKLLPNESIFNTIIDEFKEVIDGNIYLCTVYDLHYSNLDYILRKDKYTNGIPFNTAKKMFIDILKACDYLHTKLKVYHADIKTDNILLRGISNKNKKIIDLYNSFDFNNRYNYELSKCKNVGIKKKKNIRETIHFIIYNDLINLLDHTEEYDIDDEYITEPHVCLSDFGQFVKVKKGEYYEGSFGTRYYRSPENILVGKCSFSTDIWSLGCTFFEILTGSILFDPDKDKQYSRDDYHLKLINEACGDFPKKFVKSTKLYNDYFIDDKLKINKDLNYINIIENKLKNILLNEKEYNIAIKLIKGMLEIDPKKRLSCDEALKLLY